MASTQTANELEDQVAAVPFWWHSIDLGRGVVTPGGKSAEDHRRELAQLQLPALEGRSVLDIGAWDGFYSFHAERQGASRVVALDHYVWSIDFSKAHSRAGARQTQSPDEIRELWDPVGLPGKQGFDVAHAALESRVEPVVADFMHTDLSQLGQFDVVLFLGVLYHMKHPLLSLERLAQVTRGLAVIETEAVWAGDLEDSAVCEFFETDERAGDPTNWWAPNAKALVGMCRAAGFRDVDVLVSLEPRRRRRLKRALPPWRPEARAFRRGRLIAHARK